MQYSHECDVEAVNTPFSHREGIFDDYDQFIGAWLHELTPDLLAQPAMSITNGWQARYRENQWYADALGLPIYAYDSRGQGKSPKEGPLDAVQWGIDANVVVSRAFDHFDQLASQQGIEPHNKILQGNCMGTMALAAIYAGRMSLADRVDGVILISPVSSFSLPRILQPIIFLPTWFGRFAVNYLAPIFAKMAVPGEESEFSRNKAMARVRALDIPAAARQAKQMFWRENVGKYWKYIHVPSLILVGSNDPMVHVSQTAEVYHQLKYPIWIHLDAPDHSLLEDNIDYLAQIIPEFNKDPWGFYEKNRHLHPE